MDRMQVSEGDMRDLEILERTLNDGILRADIHEGFEGYIALFDCFYCDQVEIQSNTQPPVRGKQKTRQWLMKFVAPMHVVMEVGAVVLHRFEMRESSIRPDGLCVSTWELEVTGPMSPRKILRWTTSRRWAANCVVYEHIESR